MLFPLVLAPRVGRNENGIGNGKERGKEKENEVMIESGKIQKNDEIDFVCFRRQLIVILTIAA